MYLITYIFFQKPRKMSLVLKTTVVVLKPEEFKFVVKFNPFPQQWDHQCLGKSLGIIFVPEGLVYYLQIYVHK